MAPVSLGHDGRDINPFSSTNSAYCSRRPLQGSLRHMAACFRPGRLSSTLRKLATFSLTQRVSQMRKIDDHYPINKICCCIPTSLSFASSGMPEKTRIHYYLILQGMVLPWNQAHPAISTLPDIPSQGPCDCCYPKNAVSFRVVFILPSPYSRYATIFDYCCCPRMPPDRHRRKITSPPQPYSAPLNTEPIHNYNPRQ